MQDKYIHSVVITNISKLANQTYRGARKVIFMIPLRIDLAMLFALQLQTLSYVDGWKEITFLPPANEETWIIK